MDLEEFDIYEEELSCRVMLEIAEDSRILGEMTYTLEESRKRLDSIYRGE